MKYDYFIQRKRKEYGDKFDPSDLAAQFIPFFNSQERIEVDFYSATTGEPIYCERGTVGVTSGWRPCFLLMHASNHIGSSTTLHAKDRIVPFSKHFGRKYQEES